MEKNQKHNRNQKPDNKFKQPSTHDDSTKVTNADNQTAIYGKHQSLTTDQGKTRRNVPHTYIQELEYTDEEIID